MKGNTGVMVDRNSGSGRNAIIFFALAIVFRSLGVIQRAGDLLAYKYSLFTELVLPLAFCALMILCIVLFGRNHFWISIFPLAVGVLFFTLRSISTDNILAQMPEDWSVAVHICAYLAVLALFSCTVLRFPALKWTLIPIYILGSVYHIIFEDYPAVIDGGVSLSFSSVMNELSVLFMVLGLIFITFAFRSAAVEKAAGAGKLGLFARLAAKKTAKSEPGDAGTDVPEEKQEESQRAEAPETPKEEEPPKEETVPPAETLVETPAEEKPAYDESFFDQPYTAALTLDPQPDSTEDSAPAAPEE